MSVFDKKANRISVPHKQKKESNASDAVELFAGFFNPHRGETIDYQSVEKVCQNVKNRNPKVLTCPRPQYDMQGYVTYRSWRQIVEFYDNKMQTYLRMKPVPLRKIIMLEKWMIRFISPPYNENQEKVQEWREMELGKFENFYTPFCYTQFQKEVAEALKEELGSEEIQYSREQIRNIQVDVFALIPEISSSVRENRNSGVVQIENF